MKIRYFHRVLGAAAAVVVLAMAFSVLAACGDDDDDDDDDSASCPEPNLDIAVCDPAGTFTTDIDNEFFPLVVGTELVLEGEDDGEALRVEITVLDETEEVAGVTTRVVRESEYEDGEVAEISWNWFAQAEDGTVCYFGEDVDIYEDGQVVSHSGAWRAGENGYLPGILMPGDPQIGQAFYQEYAPGFAEDMSEIVDLGEQITVPAGTFTDTLSAEDCNPLEGAETDRKVYVRGIGLAIDEELELVNY